MGNVRKVAFLGTGIMGSAIAGHLLDAGYELIVYNRTRDKADGLVARGALWADSVAEAAAQADVICTMLGYPEDVESVYLSSEGLVRSSKKGAWMIDLTTSSPQLAKDIFEASEALGKHAVDCPVTGGEEGAVAGSLTLMLGANEQTVLPVLPLLQTFSSRIMYFGHAGAGQAAKLCNQVSLAANMVGYAEALALAEQAELDQGLVRELVLSGTGSSRAMEVLAPLSLDGDYRARFRSEHLVKDLGLALDEAEELQLSLPGTESTHALFRMLCEVGGARLGTQAISLLYQDEASCVAAGLDWSLLDTEECEDCDGTCDGDGRCHHHHEQ